MQTKIPITINYLARRKEIQQIVHILFINAKLIIRTVLKHRTRLKRLQLCCSEINRCDIELPVPKKKQHANKLREKNKKAHGKV